MKYAAGSSHNTTFMLSPSRTPLTTPHTSPTLCLQNTSIVATTARVSETRPSTTVARAVRASITRFTVGVREVTLPVLQQCRPVVARLLVRDFLVVMAHLLSQYLRFSFKTGLGPLSPCDVRCAVALPD